MPETASSQFAGDARFVFLSSLLGRTVVDAGGERIGKVADLVIATGEPYPPVEGLVVRGRGGRLLFPWSAAEQRDGRIALQAGAAGVPPPARPPDDRLPLDEEILDRQIVDVHDAKLVRVNDLHFIEVKGQLRLAHVDIGPRGLVRRMGWEPALDRLVRALRPGAAYLRHDQFVSWKLVQPLDRSPGRVRLEVAQRALATLHPADLAEIMEDLGRDQRTALFARLDVGTAADALEEASPELSAALLGEVPPEKAADILEEMAPDEAADALSELAGDARQEVLAAMERPEAREVQALLAYPHDSAGGLMTPDRIELGPAQTVADAIAELRRRAGELPLVYELYVIDEGRRLLGQLTLRDLLLSEPAVTLAALMRPAPATVHVEQGLREVAVAAAKYNLVSVPVVDSAGVLQGMVTVDDILAEVLDAR